MTRQWLEAARAELGGRTSISMLAVKYGFSSSGHFARRFRAAYGMTSTEWRSRLRNPPLP
ncbi:MAG TPA: helix-turn-helix domain-containing protein [Trebonia sp.]|nr:helix-turn-helix domain-containing protein [Trebonia sp.]